MNRLGKDETEVDDDIFRFTLCMLETCWLAMGPVEQCSQDVFRWIGFNQAVTGLIFRECAISRSRTESLCIDNADPGDDETSSPEFD